MDPMYIGCMDHSFGLKKKKKKRHQKGDTSCSTKTASEKSSGFVGHLAAVNTS